MVVHVCCSVDAGYFIKRLKEDFPNEKITGFFYDPNIHPYNEFKLRSIDTKRICQKLGVEFVEGDYNYEDWLKAVEGKEMEPEKGSRCSICFDHSLEATAKYAKKLGENKITTSLLMSPMKSVDQIQSVAQNIKKKYDIDFIVPNYRIKGGTQAQQLFAKENQVYRQNYCGCIYGLLKQRNNKIIHELIMPYPFQVLPASIEEKLNFYQNRLELEKKHIEYKIFKEKFLNYRLLSSAVKYKTENGKIKNINHYTLFYSYLDKKQRVKIEYEKNGAAFANRAQIIFLKVSKINEILNKNYSFVEEFYKFPLSIEEEMKIRKEITKNEYNLSPIIIVNNFENVRYDVEIKAEIYVDTREILI